MVVSFWHIILWYPHKCLFCVTTHSVHVWYCLPHDIRVVLLATRVYVVFNVKSSIIFISYLHHIEPYVLKVTWEGEWFRVTFKLLTWYMLLYKMFFFLVFCCLVLNCSNQPCQDKQEYLHWTFRPMTGQQNYNNIESGKQQITTSFVVSGEHNNVICHYVLLVVWLVGGCCLGHN